MPDVTETLRVELEEVGARRWWAALLATLPSQSGNAYMRFVGIVDGEPRYYGRTFPVPRVWGPEPPQEQWAPGMTESLTDLTHRIDGDGWRRVGCGTRAWELTYQRSSPGSQG